MSALRNRPRLLAVLTAGLLIASVCVAVTASAATSTASITKPACGGEVRVTLTAQDSTPFDVFRGSGTTLLGSFYVSAGRSQSVQFALGGTETITVKHAGTTVATASVAKAAACSPARYTTPAVTLWSITGTVKQPSCGSEAPVVLNNGMDSTRWLEVWGSGTEADLVVELAPQRAISALVKVTTTPKTVSARWNGSTLSQASVKSAAACGSPTTTAPKPATCAKADNRTGFGCPILHDGFTGTTVKTGAKGWAVYNYPNETFPRVKQNVRVTGGEVQLLGTYNRSTKVIRGAGLANGISQKYGRWEARMRVDKGRGYSAAMLLWPTSEKWPDEGEIDIVEVPWKTRATAYNVVHNNPANNAREHSYSIDASQWHTYAVEWTPTRLSYYTDGKLTWTVTDKKYIPSTGKMHMTLQFDPGVPSVCGGFWYQCPDATTPATTIMHVEYVKVWALKK